MKRIGLIFSLTILIVAMSGIFAFAGELELESTYPSDGQNNTSIENLGVKLYFNNSVSGEETIEANKDCFSIVDDEGNVIPTRVLANPNEKGIVMVLADNTSADLEVKENSTYTLKISGDFMDDEGNTLNQDKEVSFTTLNQSRNTMINMGMMGVMFVAIFIFSQKAMKKDGDKDKEVKKDTVNPYKEAKRTGKSVEAIVAEDKKKKEKAEAKAAKKASKSNDEDDYDEDDDELEDELPINMYKVKQASPITKVGGKTKSGMLKKAEERAKKKEAEEKAKNYKKSKGGKRK